MASNNAKDWSSALKIYHKIDAFGLQLEEDLTCNTNRLPTLWVCTLTSEQLGRNCKHFQLQQKRFRVTILPKKGPIAEDNFR